MNRPGRYRCFHEIVGERPGTLEATPAGACEGVESMGRGRAKAKQTKVARELKYREYNTDFSELQRELHGDEAMAPAVEVELDGAGADDDFYDDGAESAAQRY